MLKRPDKITPPPPEKFEKFKVCILGSQGVGKTALLNRMVDNSFSEKYEATIGSDFKIFKHKGVNNVQLNFWDLSGDPSYTEVRNEFYKDGQLCVVCFDITDSHSYQMVDKFVAEVRKNGGEKMPVIVVATKSEMSNRRIMPKETIQGDCIKKEYAGYYEISAKDNEGYEELVTAMKRTLKENQ